MGGLTLWHLALLSACTAAPLVLAGLGVYLAVYLGRRRRTTGGR